MQLVCLVTRQTSLIDDKPSQQHTLHFTVPLVCTVRSRIDKAWDVVVRKHPFLWEQLLGTWGFMKTGEDVFDFGRRAVIYYECEPQHEVEVKKYLRAGAPWLGHQIGSILQLKCAAAPPSCPCCVSALHTVWCSSTQQRDRCESSSIYGPYKDLPLICTYLEPPG